VSLEVRSLASGSSANCILVRDNGASLLIDAGIGVRQLVAALERAGVNPRDLSAILVTHEHTDHIAGAVRMPRRFRVPLVSNSGTLASIPGASLTLVREVEVGEEMGIQAFGVRSFPVSHDAACPVGYTITCGGATVCSATDTGTLTPEMRAEAATADLVILESNHDLEMLVKGPYPWPLKRRIMGEWGHLSNDAAAGLLTELADLGRPRTVWLAHLSKTNNSPGIALAAARKALSSRGTAPIALGVALRDVPSVSWRQGATVFQLGLFGARQ